MRLVMFDCDGVLFDSRQANIMFYNDLALRLGRGALSEAEVDYVHMHTAHESLAHLLRHASLDDMRRLDPAPDYDPYIAHMAPEETIHETLGGLKGRCRLAVCTNRTNTIGAVLERHGLAGYFDLVVSAFDVPRPKPHPDQLWKVLAAFDCPPEGALFVGDSEIDMGAAEAAGVPFVAYRNPSLAAAAHVERLIEVAALVVPA